VKLADLNNRRNSAYLIATVGAIFLAIIIYTQLASNPTQYETKLAQKRAQKDFQFKNSPESPIDREAKEDFEGLRYFPISPVYRLEAQLIPDVQPDTLTLMTTQGTDYQVVEAGKVTFSLQGGTYALRAFRYLEPGKNELFIPFQDLTSGVSTYGGGRYLDVPNTTPLILDFNTAYNPYCVYSSRYVCPLPPAENRLPLEIRSGEMMFPGE